MADRKVQVVLGRLVSLQVLLTLRSTLFLGENRASWRIQQLPNVVTQCLSSSSLRSQCSGLGERREEVLSLTHPVALWASRIYFALEKSFCCNKQVTCDNFLYSCGSQEVEINAHDVSNQDKFSLAAGLLWPLSRFLGPCLLTLITQEVQNIKKKLAQV